MTDTRRARQKIKSIPGSKLKRSEILQVRFNPKLRFAIDLLSRQEQRTISSLIEKLTGEALKTYTLKVAPYTDEEIEQTSIEKPYLEKPMEEVMNDLWHVDEAHRFINTAFHAHHLFSYEEETIWNFIKRNGYYWTMYKSKGFDEEGNSVGEVLNVMFDPDGVVWEHLERDWPLLKTGAIEEVKNYQLKKGIYDQPGKMIARPKGDPDEVVILRLFPNQKKPKKEKAKK